MRILLLTLLIAAVFVPCSCDAQDTITPRLPYSPPKAIMRTPVYLQNPAEDAMTIMWITNVPCRSWVEYGTDSLDMKKVASWDEGIMIANNKINKIALEGLAPGTKYYYRACSQEIKHYGPYDKVFGETARTPIREFKTWSEDMTDFTVLVFNDLHKKTEIFTRLMQLVGGTKYDLVIFNGDYIDDPGTEADIIDALSRYCADYGSDTVPSIFMRGNHETRGAYSPVLWDYISKVSEHSYAAFNLGDTRFVMLDCGEDKPDGNAEYSGMNDFTGYREAQADFLAAEIPSEAFEKASRRILIHHIPLYVKSVEKFNPCKELWQPYLGDADFDVALNGHTHRHEYVVKGALDNNFPVVVGGAPSNTGATVMILRKTGDELNLKVIQIDGTTLLNLDL